jgi:hypothetical protein
MFLRSFFIVSKGLKKYPKKKTAINFNKKYFSIATA